ncbi:HEAT repeat domain-containing protein [Gimesia algae]|nr:HEAT repeat domain-containing protein [Gimesia algae]
MNCVNSVTDIHTPFLNSLIGVFFGWLLITLIFNRPLSTGTKRFYYFGVPVFALGFLLIIPLGVGLIVLFSWIIYLLYRVLPVLIRKDETIHKNLIPFSVNALALSVSFILIFVTTTQANSTPGLIKSLGHVSPFYPGTVHSVMSRLIQRGPEVVDPLSKTLEQTLDREYISPFLPTRIAYCLSEIGSPQAEAVLKQVVAEEIDLSDNENTKWEAAVCCLYADCTGPRAVPVLQELLENSDEKQQFIPLCALVRTGDFNAIETVLEHVDDLQKQLQQPFTNRGFAAMIRLTLQALAEGQSPEDLKASPIYHRMLLGLRPDHQTQTGIVWNQQWDAELDIAALQDHWSHILKQKSIVEQQDAQGNPVYIIAGDTPPVEARKPVLEND